MNTLENYSHNLKSTLKKELLGDSPLKFKKIDPAIIKQNMFFFWQSFEKYDLHIKEKEKKNESNKRLIGMDSSDLSLKRSASDQNNFANINSISQFDK